MDKLPMCRICLVQNVRMYLVVNRHIHELYEKLTDIPFVTGDRRPILACYFCFTKLKQCCRFLRKCLEAEERFAQMMNEDYEPKPFIHQDHLEYLGGFIKTPIEIISIVDEYQIEIAIKEEIPPAFDGPDDSIVPKEEHQSDEPEPENIDYSYLDVKGIPPHHSKSDLEDDVPLMEFKIEVEEEQEVSKTKRRATETKSATVAKKPKLDARRIKLEDTIPAEQSKNENSDSKVIQTTQKRTSKHGTYFKEPYKGDQRSLNRVKQNTQHTRTQIGEKTYNCDVCLRNFRYKSNLIQHMRIHSGDKPYKCDVCLRSFGQNAVLKKHIRIHTGEKPYKCDVCLRTFSQKNNLTNHSRIHSGEKPYKCDVCLRSFSQKTHLTEHIRIHTGERPYKCDVCQRSFKKNNDLTKHIRSHTGEKPFMCDVCLRSFSKKINLTKHIHKHTSENPNKCDVCLRSFSDKEHLSKHIRIHIREKPYKCDVCLRSFNQKRDLQQHTRTHTGEKPYKCDVCQQSFSQNSNLTRHIRVHTGKKLNKSSGEKSFKCENTNNILA